MKAGKTFPLKPGLGFGTISLTLRLFCILFNALTNFQLVLLLIIGIWHIEQSPETLSCGLQKVRFSLPLIKIRKENGFTKRK